MAPLGFLRFVTVVSLAVLQASFDALPVNALAVEHGHLGRGLSHAHADIAKKRDSPSSKKCRPRPTTSPKPAADNVPAPSTPSHSTQPASTTTSSQPPPANTPSSSGGGGKSFLAWSNNEQGSLEHFVSNNPAIYNWHITKYTQDDLGPSLKIFETMDFIPTIHGWAEVPQIAGTLTKGYATKVFNVNEPDVNKIDAGAWFTAHMEHIKPLQNLGYQLFTPSVTTSDDGFKWLTQFMGMCNGNCGITAMNIHHYSINASQLVAASSRFNKAFDLPIWYGEVGCQDYSGKNQPCDQGTFNTFFTTVMDHVQSTPYVKHIAWFGFFTPSEIEANNVDTRNVMMDCGTGTSSCVPNQLGKTFLNY